MVLVLAEIAQLVAILKESVEKDAENYLDEIVEALQQTGPDPLVNALQRQAERCQLRIEQIYAILALANDEDCGNPDCPVHGTQRVSSDAN